MHGDNIENSAKSKSLLTGIEKYVSELVKSGTKICPRIIQISINFNEEVNLLGKSTPISGLHQFSMNEFESLNPSSIEMCKYFAIELVKLYSISNSSLKYKTIF